MCSECASCIDGPVFPAHELLFCFSRRPGGRRPFRVPDHGLGGATITLPGRFRTNWAAEAAGTGANVTLAPDEMTGARGNARLLCPQVPQLFEVGIHFPLVGTRCRIEAWMTSGESILWVAWTIRGLSRSLTAGSRPRPPVSSICSGFVGPMVSVVRGAGARLRGKQFVVSSAASRASVRPRRRLARSSRARVRHCGRGSWQCGTSRPRNSGLVRWACNAFWGWAVTRPRGLGCTNCGVRWCGPDGTNSMEKSRWTRLTSADRRPT